MDNLNALTRRLYLVSILLNAVLFVLEPEKRIVRLCAIIILGAAYAWRKTDPTYSESLWSNQSDAERQEQQSGWVDVLIVIAVGLLIFS